MTTQTEIINLEDLVPTNHLYRKFTKLIDLDKITNKFGEFTIEVVGWN